MGQVLFWKEQYSSSSELWIMVFGSEKQCRMENALSLAPSDIQVIGWVKVSIRFAKIA
jgi:hypothetical protein